MRIAIIGAGTIGAVHAKLIESLQGKATLVAVVDTEFDRATSLAAQYGAQPYRDLASAFAAEEIDSVSVCLPSALHTDAAAEAPAAGKDLLTPKPPRLAT